VLKFIRRNATAAWVKFIFLAIVVVFIFWGMGGIVRGDKARFVARVNEDRISPTQLSRAHDNLRRLYREIYKENFRPELVQALDLKGKALDQLIRVSLLRQEAHRLGLSVSDAEVREAIAVMPAFQQNGTFNKDIYVRLLRANRVTPAEFEESKQEEILVEKLQNLIAGGVHVADAEVLDRYRFDNEKVNLRFIKLESASFAPRVELTDADVQAYFEKKRDAFREPERMRIEYVLYEPERFQAQIKPSDQEVKAYYQAHSAEYQKPDGGGEQTLDEVRAQLVTQVTQEKARNLAAERAEEAQSKAAAGGSLADVAQAAGLKVITPAPFAASEPVASLGRIPELAKAAFATPAGGVGPMIDIPKGHLVFRSVEKVASRVPELAEIRSRVETAARNERADALVKSTADTMLAELQKGSDIDTVAKAHDAKVEESGIFARSVSAIPNLGVVPALKKDAFQTTAEKPVAPAVYTVPGGSVVAVIKERIPAEQESFAGQKDTLKKQAEERAKALALEQFVNSLIARATIERNEDALAGISDNGDGGSPQRR